jgi:hypothetical protein
MNNDHHGEVGSSASTTKERETVHRLPWRTKLRQALWKARGGAARLCYRSVAMHSLLSQNDRRIGVLRDVDRGRRCFILGNGPSLQIADLDRLRNEVTFAHNKVFLAFDRTSWRPTYYNVEDDMVIRQNRDAINSLKGFPKLLNNCDPNAWNIDEWTITYNLLVSATRQFPEFSNNPFAGLRCGYSVCYSSLQWAYFMGFREIYLLGMDFTFVVPHTTKDGLICSQGEVNHFMPNYRQKGEIWVTPRLDEQARAFTYGRDWLARRGVQVYNATRGGRLEVFPRVCFDSLF